MEVKVDTSEVQKALNRIVQIADGELPWKSIGITAELSVDQNFEQGGRYNTKEDPVGGPNKWVKRKKDVPWDLLQKSLKLRQSIYSKPSKDGVDIGSKGLAYNRAQNLGSPGNNLPARPFLTIAPDDLQKITDEIEQAITEAFE